VRENRDARDRALERLPGGCKPFQTGAKHFQIFRLESASFSKDSFGGFGCFQWVTRPASPIFVFSKFLRRGGPRKQDMTSRSLAAMRHWSVLADRKTNLAQT
jgi:hypothetical protein